MPRVIVRKHMDDLESFEEMSSQINEALSKKGFEPDRYRTSYNQKTRLGMAVYSYETSYPEGLEDSLESILKDFELRMGYFD